MEKVYAKNREEWRAWLADNHGQAKEICLVYYKRGTGKPSVNYEESVEEALCYGWIDGVRKSLGEESYVIRFTPRRPDSIWSKVNCERIEAAIQTGKMTPEGMKTVEDAKQNGQWEAAYRMKDKQEIPEDFKNALMQNPVAWEHFNQFSNSVQFTFIYRIANIKGAALRAEKSGRPWSFAKKTCSPTVPTANPGFEYEGSQMYEVGSRKQDVRSESGIFHRVSTFLIPLVIIGTLPNQPISTSS